MTVGKQGAAAAPNNRGVSAPTRQIRARFSDTTIRVYQAFSPEIASKATLAQKFVSPFKRDRMTWIKPSFAWMMYRSGWGTKAGQERILGIDILRSGFEWALAHACVTHFDAAVHGSPEEWQMKLRAAPVRVQWDPERTLHLEALPWRSIQVGLRGEAVDAYLDEWITNIEDVTALAGEVEAAMRRNDVDRARALVPIELPYSLPEEIARRLGCVMDEAG